MLLWRISNYTTLDGVGGLKASHRWHTRGHPIVYCVPNPATALLEVLVHLEVALEDIPLQYRFLKIEASNNPPTERVEHDQLPQGWQSDVSVTPHLGDTWLQSKRTALLEVPSVLVPETFNILLNPLHPDAARIQIVAVVEHPFDPRLL
ncbi:MAG: RES family NAD+ phosphorylase [Deltaproteobacteria bacterium]|nr:RES family NAD+ phosphorylase [Deltaproteobacteria bacterium]